MRKEKSMKIARNDIEKRKKKEKIFYKKNEKVKKNMKKYLEKS